MQSMLRISPTPEGIGTLVDSPMQIDSPGQYLTHTDLNLKQMWAQLGWPFALVCIYKICFPRLLYAGRAIDAGM